ncbi:ATP-binding protein [Streptomyces sp. J2-1]|uniref:ATP-binding protein n=1 Tax=Streptomyces corallincola TaxID=2851888 RepID=UPI001C390F5C|nr:ATP-binding protein [Streptomyces corallincola]MBV2358051.1 ATP-binding protein [Streptomyces corallincola]
MRAYEASPTTPSAVPAPTPASGGAPAAGADGCPVCLRPAAPGEPDPGGPPVLRLDSEHVTLGAARRAAGQYAAARCPRIDTGHVELVVSELCTNALRHATGWWSLRLHTHGDRLVLDVDDVSVSAPRPRTPDLEHGSGGLGMVLVDELTASWRVIRRPDGKTVRAVFAT